MTQKEFTSRALTTKQVIGLLIWIGALLPIILGEPLLCLFLIVYLFACVVEVYTLKFFIVPREVLTSAMEAIPYSPYLDFIIPHEGELEMRVENFSKPIDMDNKVNKITYQKSRIIGLLLIILIYQVTDQVSIMLIGDPAYDTFHRT